MIKNIYNLIPLEIENEDGSTKIIFYNIQKKIAYDIEGVQYQEDISKLTDTIFTEKSKYDFTNVGLQIMSKLDNAQEKYDTVYENSEEMRNKHVESN